MAAKHVSVWWVEESPFMADGIAGCWPGWSVTLWGSDPRPHLAELRALGHPIDLGRPPLDGQIRTLLERAVAQRGRRDKPLWGVVQALKAQGKRVDANLEARIARASAVEDDEVVQVEPLVDDLLVALDLVERGG